MNIPEALEMRLRAKRRDQKHKWYTKKTASIRSLFAWGSSAADKHVGSVSVEASVWVKEEVPCSFWASVIHDSFWMERTRAIHETTEASGEGRLDRRSNP